MADDAAKQELELDVEFAMKALAEDAPGLGEERLAKVAEIARSGNPILLDEWRITSQAMKDPETGFRHHSSVGRWPDVPKQKPGVRVTTVRRLLQKARERREFESEYGWDGSLMAAFPRKSFL